MSCCNTQSDFSMKMKIETYLPLRRESEEIDANSSLLSDELVKASGQISLPLDDFGTPKVNMKIIGDSELDRLKQRFPKYFENEPLLVIHFSTELDFECVYEYDMSDFPSWLSNEKLNEATLVGIYRSRFFNFLVFTQLAVPGSLLSQKGFHMLNNEYREDFREISSCLIGLGYEEKPIWPFPKTIQIDKVWNYILNRTNILDSESSTKIERGLNAFSYLYDDNDSSANSLFWSMTGVEALYVDGDIGIGYQINNKAKLFLGEPLENKRILTRLYDYRSKFLHGKKSIPLNHGWLDGEFTDKHDLEFSDNVLVSAKLLTVTLQQIIIKDIVEFDFEYKLKD